MPDIRLQLTGLLEGTIDLDQFQDWFASTAMDIERLGTDAEVDLLNRVQNLLAEYTGDHISAPELLEALREESNEYIRVPEPSSVS
jgi:hypothetical protein